MATPSSTSSSERPATGGARDRTFLVWLALLVVGLELGLGLTLRPSRGRHEVDERVARVSAPVEDRANPPRTVLLTDSISYRALPADRGDVLDLSSNRALTVAGNHLLLRRLLERREAAGTRVERVVYCLSPRSWEARVEPGGLSRPYFSSVFTRPEEVAHLSDLGLSEEVLEIMRDEHLRRRLLPPSFLRRGHLLRPLAGLARDVSRTLRGPQEPPALPSPACLDHLDRAGNRSGFELPPLAHRSLEDMIALCAEHGAELWIVTAPLAPTLEARWRASGYWQAYTHCFRTLAGQHPHVRFLERTGFEAPSDASFYDGEHLVLSEKLRWGQVLARLVEPM